MVREKILTGFSVMFRSLRSLRSPAGQVERLRVHLDRVALCRLSLAAYEESQVLAVRHRPPAPPLLFDPKLVERLEQLSIEVPDTLRVS
jgi:hypothetical protein